MSETKYQLRDGPGAGAGAHSGFAPVPIRPARAPLSAKDKAYRVRGIPTHFEISDVEDLLRSALLWDDTTVVISIRSLALSADRQDQVAVVNIGGDLPGLDQQREEWHIDISHYFSSQKGSIQRHREISVDTHFRGMTMVRSFENEADHKVDCIALTGLGGHAFGSFKEKDGPHMWLCDDLPYDLHGARIMIYGHNTQVHGSHSFQDLEAVASSFRLSIEALCSPLTTPCRMIPLIFIGHSLGGLVVKEAIIQLSHTQSRSRAFDSIYGALFFGVPHMGMEINSLLPMIKQQPNQQLIHTLGKNSQLLREKRRQFEKAFDFQASSEIIYFYETQTSPTALQGDDGIWRMRGPETVLVDEASATAGRWWETEPYHKQAINCNHSNLVKFAAHDDSYKHVLGVLRRFASTAGTVIPRATRPTVAFDSNRDEYATGIRPASQSRVEPQPPPPRPLQDNAQDRYPSPYPRSSPSPAPPPTYPQPSAYSQPFASALTAPFPTSNQQQQLYPPVSDPSRSHSPDYQPTAEIIGSNTEPVAPRSTSELIRGMRNLLRVDFSSSSKGGESTTGGRHEYADAHPPAQQVPPAQQIQPPQQTQPVQQTPSQPSSGLGSTHPRLPGTQVAGPIWGTTGMSGWIRIPIRSRGHGTYSMVLRDAYERGVVVNGGGRIRFLNLDKEIHQWTFGPKDTKGRNTDQALM